MQGFRECEHPWAAWADPGAWPEPDAVGRLGMNLGTWAKCLRKAPKPGPWRLAGGSAMERQRSQSELRELLKVAGSWGAPFVILPGQEAMAYGSQPLERLGVLLDELGAHAEREGVALWVPMGLGSQGYLPGPVEAAAWVLRLGLPFLKIAPTWQTGLAPWTEGEAWTWTALAPHLGGALLSAEGPPEEGWAWPEGAGDRLPLVWWPQGRRSAQALVSGAKAWENAQILPKNPEPDASFS